jgi:NitT/TauT family transport system substrate-binding protein
VRIVPGDCHFTCIGGAIARKPEKIRIAYPTISITLAPLWMAKDTGLFEQEGLDAELTYIRGGTTIVQAVIGGDVQVGYAGVPPILSAMARGAPLVVVGKKFAISSFGSSSEFVARLGLQKLGADPIKVTMVQVGGSPDRIIASKTGAVDATILSATDFVEASGLGFHTVLDLSKCDIDYPFNVFFALRSFAMDKKTAISGTLKSFVNAARFFEVKRKRL